MNKVDILAFGAHPDDVELGCAGTLIKAVEHGQSVGICDLTQGELGTRGNATIRLEEAKRAKGLIRADFRVNLGMKDGFFEVDEQHKLRLVEIIRACRPTVVLCNALSDRHPDHGRGAELQKTACFLSGLMKLDTIYDGEKQDAWRPKVVMHYVQDNFLEPDIVIDITKQWDMKLKSILAFASQFYDPDSKEPKSPISSKEFMEIQEGRALQQGRYIGVRYGEGFISERPLGVDLPANLL